MIDLTDFALATATSVAEAARHADAAMRAFGAEVAEASRLYRELNRLLLRAGLVESRVRSSRRRRRKHPSIRRRTR